jgi:hypothetical protein
VIVERLPDGVVVVHRQRIADVHLLDGPAHVVEIALEVELRRLDADDGQPVVAVLVGPCPHVGKRTDPVDAGVGAEAGEDHVTSQAPGRQRWRVQPGGRSVEGGELAFDGKLVAMA